MLHWDYPGSMFSKRLLQLLTLLALLLAPFGMLGGHAAMAMPVGGAMAMNHCDEQQQAPKDHKRQAMIDCATACSAMPAVGAFVMPQPIFSARKFEADVSVDIAGVRPEAATPPPRAV